MIPPFYLNGFTFVEATIFPPNECSCFLICLTALSPPSNPIHFSHYNQKNLFKLQFSSFSNRKSKLFILALLTSTLAVTHLLSLSSGCSFILQPRQIPQTCQVVLCLQASVHSRLWNNLSENCQIINQVSQSMKSFFFLSLALLW